MLRQGMDGSTARLPFRCLHGHEAARRLDHLKERPFCLTCAKLQRDHSGPFAALLRDAMDKGIACLDSEWLGADHSYRFRCAEGHEWTRKQIGSGKGRGCPTCARTASKRTYTVGANSNLTTYAN